MRTVKLLEIQPIDARMNFMHVKIQKQVLISLLFLMGMLCFSACNTKEISSGVSTVRGKSFVNGLRDVLDGTLQTVKMNKAVWLVPDADNTIYAVEEYKGIRSISEKENKLMTPYGKEVPVDLYANPQAFFSKQNEYSFFLDAIITDNVLFTVFVNHGEQYISFINLKNYKASTFRNFTWAPGRLLFYKDKSLYSLASSLSIIEDNNTYTPGIVNYPLEVNSNPVVLKFKIKSL